MGLSLKLAQILGWYQPQIWVGFDRIGRYLSAVCLQFVVQVVTSALRRSRTSKDSSSPPSVQRGAGGSVAGAAWPGKGLEHSQAEKEKGCDMG